MSATVLAQLAPEQAQARALARHTFLWADAFLAWASRWRKDLARSDNRTDIAHARQLKEPLARFRDRVQGAAGIRDYLAAKRQPLSPARAADMDATMLLWLSLHPAAIEEIHWATAELYDALAVCAAPRPPICQSLPLSLEVQAEVTKALPRREPYWYLAADTGADVRPYTLPAAQGGQLGRVIAQINDVGIALDTIIRIAPVIDGHAPFDWFVRAALFVEVSALLDLTFGREFLTSQPQRPSLLDFCRRGRLAVAGSELERLRDSVPVESRLTVRWARDKLGAHLDRDLSMFQIHDYLARVDIASFIRLAEHVLDWLDHLGATQLGLQILLLGERRINSWPLNKPVRGLQPPRPNQIPGTLARLFRSIDSPYMAAVGAPSASPVLAGVSSARQPQPRQRIEVRRPWSRLWDAPPPEVDQLLS